MKRKKGHTQVATTVSAKRCTYLLKTSLVGAVRGHHAMQTASAGQKASFLGLFGFVMAFDQTHILGHTITVEIRGPKRVLLNGPARRKNCKIAKRGAGLCSRAGEHGKDGRILSMTPATREKMVEVGQYTLEHRKASC